MVAASRISEHPCRVQLPEHRQFNLKSLFAVTAIVAVQLALIRLIGPVMIPLCVQASATAVLLVWTRGRAWNGAATGFALGCLFAALLASGAPSIRTAIFLPLLSATFGSWIGAAIKGAAECYPNCDVGLVAAILWALAAIAILI